jgi:hypothetical protein
LRISLADLAAHASPDEVLGMDKGFVDINAITLNAAISGSIFAVPDACFVMMMALPFSSTRALATAQGISL